MTSRARTLASLAIVLALRAGDAFADEGELAGRMAGEPVIDTALWWSGDLAVRGSSHLGYGTTTGFVTALGGDIGSTGWIVGASLGGYRTTSPVNEKNTFAGALLAGHQWQVPGIYFSLMAGLQLVEIDETPGGGPADGGEIGTILQFGFETKWVDAPYFQTSGAYSTAFDQAYLQARAGYRMQTLRFGAEFLVSDDANGEPTLRYGAFVGDIPVADGTTMTLSAGYQDEQAKGEPDGFYAQVGFSVPLDLR